MSSPMLAPILAADSLTESSPKCAQLAVVCTRVWPNSFDYRQALLHRQRLGTND